MCKTSSDETADIRVARATVDISRTRETQRVVGDDGVEIVDLDGEPNNTVNIIGIRVNSTFINKVSLFVSYHHIQYIEFTLMLMYGYEVKVELLYCYKYFTYNLLSDC